MHNNLIAMADHNYEPINGDETLDANVDLEHQRINFDGLGFQEYDPLCVTSELSPDERQYIASLGLRPDTYEVFEPSD
jgi:hypothetical protein